jgi:hypothetical protein
MGLLLQRMRQLFSRPAFKRVAAMFVDAVIVIESFAVALLFRFNGNVEWEFWRTFWPFAIFAALASLYTKRSSLVPLLGSAPFTSSRSPFNLSSWSSAKSGRYHSPSRS